MCDATKSFGGRRVDLGGTMGLALALALTACASPASQGGKDASAAPAWAPKYGVYVSGMLPYHQHGHDDEIVAGGGSAELLPELDPGFGWGAALGLRAPRTAFEFNYQSTEHDASSTSGFDSRFLGYNLDFKFFLREERVQPFLLLGLGAHCVEVEDGSAGAGGEVEDAVFGGIGFQVGGGVQVYTSPRVAFFLQGGYRFTSFDTVEGVVDGDLADEIDDSGVFAAAGASYTF